MPKCDPLSLFVRPGCRDAARAKALIAAPAACCDAVPNGSRGSQPLWDPAGRGRTGRTAVSTRST